jgi:hypothetical protein
MNQSTVIFGYLFVAFLIFITMRGELPVYAGFLLSTPKASGNSGNVGANTQSSATDAIKGAAEIAAFL